MLLGFIAQTESTPSDLHWKFVKGVFSGGKLSDPLWMNVRPLLRLLVSNDQKYEAATELTGKVEDLMAKQAFTFVQRCLQHLANRTPKIAVAVEPIDTPDSPLEKADTQIAQDVIAALINVFLRSFQPSENQLLNVYIAVPWHRYTTEGLINPQKRREYEAQLKWTNDELGKFMASRIQYEFRSVGRQVKSPAAVWAELFVPTMWNTYCQTKFEESTFTYILRHTHHRPRDVQHICREAVFMCAKRAGLEANDVLRGKSGIRVDGAHIREAVQSYCTDALEDFQEEAKRRFPDMPRLESSVRGISVPFTTEHLKKRAEDAGITTEIRDVIMKLWETGYLGVEVRCLDNKKVDQLKALFPVETFICHKTDRTEFNRWYFFVYNWKGEPFELLAKAESQPHLEAKCVLHARTFDKIAGYVTQEWPVGI